MNKYVVFAGEVKGQLKLKMLLPKEEALAYAKELESGIDKVEQDL
jgi:hypothetical protein